MTVRVLPGTYSGGFQTIASGTADARIRYVSEVKRGAKIVPLASSTTISAWDNRGNYVDIDGFEVNGSATQAGTKWLNGIYTAGSYGSVRNNYVHHIAKTVACSGSGGGSARTAITRALPTMSSRTWCMTWGRPPAPPSSASSSTPRAAGSTTT
ncbi:hypothetical protein LP419_03025 [Massilia sp. H-1]|nr:hypothetical protein LP419_03025 [Massilia sp. H-1]